MTPSIYALLFAAGVAAGIINTVAGGGSVLTLPALIFAGIPSSVANATNRIGIIAQNLTAIRQFRKHGVEEWPLAWRLTAAGVVGSAIGAFLAAHIPDDKFEKILGILMLALLPLTLIKPRKKKEADSASGQTDDWTPLPQSKRVLSLAVFFLLGIYGGFLQAGIGIMILIAMDHMLHTGLIRANYVKLVFVLAVTVLAFLVFLAQGVRIEWMAGIVLTIGQSVGAWAGSWVAVKKGEKVIRAVMIISILGSSAKLLDLF